MQSAMVELHFGWGPQGPGWNRMLRRIWNGFREAVRRYFVAGLLAFAPIAITVWAIAWIVQRLDKVSPGQTVTITESQ